LDHVSQDLALATRVKHASVHNTTVSRLSASSSEKDGALIAGIFSLPLTAAAENTRANQTLKNRQDVHCHEINMLRKWDREKERRITALEELVSRGAAGKNGQEQGRDAIEKSDQEEGGDLAETKDQSDTGGST
jgi:hypothetical protein